MTPKKLFNYTMAALLFFPGLASIYFAFVMLHSIDDAIFYANLAILNGESIFSFMKPMAALLSGGHLQIIENSVIYSFVISGWISVWLGIQMAIFTHKGLPLKALVSPKFWSIVDFEFVHSRKYKKKDLAIFKRPSKKKTGVRNGVSA